MYIYRKMAYIKNYNPPKIFLPACSTCRSKHIMAEYAPAKNTLYSLFIIYILRFTHSFLHEKTCLKKCDSQSQQRNGFLTRA